MARDSSKKTSTGEPRAVPSASDASLAGVDMTDPQQTTRNQIMTEKEFKSLRTVVEYLWNDEQKYFHECEFNDGKAPGDHVFRHLLVLGDCLTNHIEAKT